MESRQIPEHQPNLNVRAILQGDPMDFFNLDIFDQAFKQRILLAYWPTDKREIFLKKWFKENKDNFYQQIKSIVKITVPCNKIKSLTDIITNELCQFLIEFSDDTLFDEFKKYIDQFCQQNMHMACRGRIADYTIEARELLLENYPGDDSLKHQVFYFWTQLYFLTLSSLEMNLYRFENSLGNLGLSFGLALAIQSYLNDESFPNVAFNVLGGLIIFSIIRSGYLPFFVSTFKIIYKEYTFQPNTPEIKQDSNLFKKNLNHGIMQYLMQQKVDESKPGEYPFHVLRDALQQREKYFNSTCFVKSGLSALPKIKKQNTEPTPTFSDEVKSSVAEPLYHDYAISGGHLLEMKNGSYVRFIPEEIERQFSSKKGPERGKITQRFFNQLRENREIAPPAKTERTSKKSPFKNTNGKERLPRAFSAYRLSYITVPPSLEEQKLTKNNVNLLTPKNLVLHGRRGY